jgi:hypothetical protein
LNYIGQPHMLKEVELEDPESFGNLLILKEHLTI